jgi:hypothetical protein
MYLKFDSDGCLPHRSDTWKYMQENVVSIEPIFTFFNVMGFL